MVDSPPSRSRLAVWLLVTAAVFLAFAPTRYFAAKRLLRAHQWTLLRHDVTLAPGERVRVTLLPDATAMYLVSIKFKSPSEQARLPLFECDIGWSVMAESNCANNTIAIDMTWSVRDENGHVVSQPESAPRAGSRGENYGTVYLGHFNAVSGQKYSIESTLNNALPRFREYRPSLEVAIEPMRFKNAIASAQFNALLGIASAGLGVFLIGAAGILWRLQHRQNRSSPASP